MSIESSEEMPEGWAWALLRDLTSPSSEKVEPQERPDSPYLSLEHIEPHSNQIIGQGTSADVSSTKSVFRSGDVLYGKLRPYLNKVAVPEFDGICSTDILVFRKIEYLHSRFLAFFLSRRETVGFANHNSTGVQLPRISFKDLGMLPVPIPPLAEQRRIVAAVERILEKVSSARERLERVPTTMKRFRQAVLAAACSGRLTADWRINNPPTKSTEDYRQELLRQRAMALNGQKMTKTPARADADYLGEIPEGWAIFSLEELATLITSGSRDWSKYYGSGSGTFIMAQNVRPGILDLSYRHVVGPPKDDRDARRSQVACGDLLVTIVGANTGDSCVVPRELPEHYVCQSVALVRLAESCMGTYINLFYNSDQFGRGQFARYIYGEGRPHLGFDHIKMSAVLLPPIDEQLEIVLRVSEFFAFADTIEQRATSALKRVERITQSVLAKAFRGELVPTEAELARREGRSYEPASELLARLKASSNGEAKVKRPRGRK